MLAKLNVRYVIVGHSERRQHFGETDEVVARKIDAVLRNGMMPIVCVGETLDERDAGDAEAKVRGPGARRARGPSDRRQSRRSSSPTSRSGRSAPARRRRPSDAQEMCAAIRSESGTSRRSAAAAIRIQYGGSVNPETAGELLAGADVDGFLVGGASLDAQRFVAIVRAGT